MFGIPEWAIGVGFIILAGSIARAVFGRAQPHDGLPGRHGSRRDLSQALDGLQQRLGAIESGQQGLAQDEGVATRLAEIEERLDFVERMLAKQRDADRIAPPQP
jgi:hypothetical protein